MAKTPKDKAPATAPVVTAKTVIRPKLEDYVSARSASGSKTQHNGDPVASSLEGATLEEVFDLASEVTEIPVTELTAKYAHLNIGQQRMNCGNRIRGVVNKLNKEKEGSGDKYIKQMASALRVAVDGRAKELAAKAKAKEAEKLAKLKETKETKATKEPKSAAKKAA